MGSLPLVSIIIPTYGRSEMLQRAIRSVLNQTYKNVEIIVVDDNDADSNYRVETEASLEKYLDNDKVIYIKHEKNAGGCVARNTGIASAKGEFIGFLDDDDEWLPEFIDKHLAVMSNGADIVYCNFFSVDSAKRGEKSRVVSRNERGDVFNHLLQGWCPATTSMFIVRKECFETSGYFDESLQSFQDYDKWLSIARNHKFDYCEEYLMIKYQHGFEQLARNPIKRQHALDTLTKKWKDLLNDGEKKLFENALKIFQKDIYYNRFYQARSKRKVKETIENFLNVLKSGNHSIKYIIKLTILLIFGKKI
jgi:glycosyltransferase involved in cell wall biosynthesis